MTKRIQMIAVGLLAVVSIGLSAAPAGAADKVTVEGHVWRAALDGVDITVHRAGGATVRIAEFPELSTTAAADGYWTLEVPDRASITPCAELDGHHPSCDQTFFTRGKDLNQVNFQIVADQIAGLLGTFSGGEMEPGPFGAPRVKECAIVSTFYEKEKRSFFDFQDFLNAFPHGVAGATAIATAEDGTVIPGPIYYNESVIPDRSYVASSRDGGVMWVNIPPGRYWITASHPTTRFAPFLATCEQGRLINANPPWGLYEMHRTEEPNPAVLPAPVIPEPEPEPEPVDKTVEAVVASARVIRRGPRIRILQVRIRAGETVGANLVARQGKRRAGSGPRRLAPGPRTLRLRIGRAYRRGPLNLTVRLRDRAGNVAVSNSRLFVPALRPRRR